MVLVEGLGFRVWCLGFRFGGFPGAEAVGGACLGVLQVLAHACFTFWVFESRVWSLGFITHTHTQTLTHTLTHTHKHEHT